jgi:hypothetical protein
MEQVPQVGYDGSPRHWPLWVFYGGKVWSRDIAGPYDRYGRFSIPWRVWPVVDVAGDEHGDGLIVRILGTGTVDAGGLDVVIDDWDLDPIGYQELPDEPTMPCGCTDYHMADCPLVTDRYDAGSYDFEAMGDNEMDW